MKHNFSKISNTHLVLFIDIRSNGNSASQAQTKSHPITKIKKNTKIWEKNLKASS